MACVEDAVLRASSRIEELCSRLRVRRLDVFGSAVTGTFDDQTSDIDFLVEFDTSGHFDYFNTFFALKEGLEEIFGRPVDLVSVTALRNPYVRRSVMDTREQLYAA